MFNMVEYNEVADDNEVIFIDVRTPKEFNEDSIYGAINIPVLLDEERVEVGTIYVQKSVEEAKSRGIELISKRLPQIFDEFQKLYMENRDKKIVVFCARGGMRSGSIHALLLSLGIKVYKLKQGYKGYRKYINEKFNTILDEVEFVVLHGKTGTGKTLILNTLEKEGYNVLDLELAANHRGSLLGGVGLGKQNSQKHFENYIFNTLKNRKGNTVFVEGESKRIGNVILPVSLWNKMRDGKQVLIKVSNELRTEILINEYAKNEEEVKELIASLDSLKKYMNDSRVEGYKEKIKKGEFYEVAVELMEKYYDPLYNNSLKDISYTKIFEIESLNQGVNELKKNFENQKFKRD